MSDVSQLAQLSQNPSAILLGVGVTVYIFKTAKEMFGKPPKQPPPPKASDSAEYKEIQATLKEAAALLVGLSNSHKNLKDESDRTHRRIGGLETYVGEMAKDFSTQAMLTGDIKNIVLGTNKNLNEFRLETAKGTT